MMRAKFSSFARINHFKATGGISLAAATARRLTNRRRAGSSPPLNSKGFLWRANEIQLTHYQPVGRVACYQSVCYADYQISSN